MEFMKPSCKRIHVSEMQCSAMVNNNDSDGVAAVTKLMTLYSVQSDKFPLQLSYLSRQMIEMQIRMTNTTEILTSTRCFFEGKHNSVTNLFSLPTFPNTITWPENISI